MLCTVSACHEKDGKYNLTTVETALVRASLIFVGDICTSVLIKIAGTIVPTSVTAQADVAEQAAGGLPCVHARYQV
jgi:hypothetical protein